MTKHIAFEYGVAYSITPTRQKRLMPHMSRRNFRHIDYEKVFYRSLARIDSLHMYDSFLESGWTTQLAFDTHQVLIPEIIRAVTLNWASCINEAMEVKNAKK